MYAPTFVGIRVRLTIDIVLPEKDASEMFLFTSESSAGPATRRVYNMQ